MYRSEVHTISSTKTDRDAAIQETTRKANDFMRETPMQEILHYNIQTIYEPGLNGEDGYPEMYTHVFSIVFRRP